MGGVLGTHRPAAQSGEAASGELLIARVRDAMLGLAPVPAEVPPGRLRTGLAGALADFRYCRYARLADGLPRLICGGHAIAAQAGEDPEASALLAGIYTLATRMLIKLDDQQLGWMAADRARVIAAGSGNPSSPPRRPATSPSWPAKPAGIPRQCPSR